MKRTLLAIGLTLALGMSVQAKIPSEVMEPYKAYRAALAGDKKNVTKFAYEAWQKAEELMGDSKTTGDLASNFADLEPRSLNSKDASKKVAKAYKRSIELSHLHGDVGADVEVQRRIDYLAWALQFRNLSHGADYNSKALAKFIDSQGWGGTTYEGDMHSLRAQDEFYDENWKAAEEHALAAMKVYDTANDNLISYFKYVVPIFYAKSLAEMDRPIEAALAYQDLMDSLENSAGHENKVSDVTYGQWLALKEQVLEESPNDPRVAKIKDYQMPSRRTALFAPLERIPPRFPPKFLRGNYSGYVTLKFDVDVDGKVLNAVVTGSTNKKLDEAALESVLKWRYSPNIPAEDAKGIESTIRFDLQDERGKYLPLQNYKSY